MFGQKFSRKIITMRIAVSSFSLPPSFAILRALEGVEQKVMARVCYVIGSRCDEVMMIQMAFTLISFTNLAEYDIADLGAGEANKFFEQQSAVVVMSCSLREKRLQLNLNKAETFCS